MALEFSGDGAEPHWSGSGKNHLPCDWWLRPPGKSNHCAEEGTERDRWRKRKGTAKEMEKEQLGVSESSRLWTDEEMRSN